MALHYEPKDLQKICNTGNSGYYITIDYIHLSPSWSFNHQTIEKIRSDVTEIQNRLNKYCFGKKKKNRFSSYGCIEIGDKDQRLHLHLVLVHNQSTNKSKEEIDDYLRRGFNEKFGFARSENSIKVLDYNKQLEASNIKYHLKQQDYFIKKYGSSNIV